jgi:isochorismate synthase
MPNVSISEKLTFSEYLEQSKIHWKENSILFSSPTNTVVGSGIGLSMEIDTDSDIDVEKQIRSLLKQASKKKLPPIVIGALAFDGRSRSRFFVPETVKIIASDTLRHLLVSSEVVSQDVKNIHFHPHPEAYMKSVEQALNKIKKGTLEKVVLARLLELEMESTINVTSIVNQLMSQSCSNYVFSLPAIHDSQRENSVFLGASPELLVRKEQANIESNPLAGSIASVTDIEKNAINRYRLLHSEKDIREHEFARQAVAETLYPFCREMNVPPLDVISAGPVMHLSTRISGVLHNTEKNVDSLLLAKHLHPTPAVCGTPTDLAKETINEIETFNRGLYSGRVGWCDNQGNGEWAVTIRCAEINGNRATLFSGAGIVEESCPESELKETNTKLKTMLRVLGVRDVNAIQEPAI